MATLLDNLVTDLYFFNQTNDYYYAMTEFAVGFARTTTRSLDLCYGAAVTNNEINAPPYNVTFGVAYTRLNNVVQPTVFNSSSSFEINFLSCLPNNIFIDSGIIVGSVYLVADVDMSNNVTYNIVAIPYQNNSNIIAINSTADQIYNNLFDGQYLPTPPTNQHYLEIYRFLIQTSNIYVSSNIIASQYVNWTFSIDFIDLRKPRGFPGYANKKLAFNLLNRTINLQEGNLVVYGEYKKSVTKMVSDWLNYTTWVPDLYTYWATSGNQIPMNLQTYILQELGINIPNSPPPV